MPLHVLQLGPVPPPEGGISRNIFAIRDELKSHGHRCSIAATSKSERELTEDDIFYPRRKREMLSLLRSLDHDILHLHVGGDITARVLSLAFACTVLARGKCVLTVHSGGYAFTSAAKNAGPASFAGIIFRRFERVIAVNGELADVFKNFGVADEKVEVILPFSVRPPSEDAVLPTGLAAFCKEASPLFVSVGGLEKDYEPLLQIKAFQAVLATQPSARLVIVGGGSMKKEIEDAIERAGLSRSVHLAGSIDHESTLLLMKRADAMVRITLFDGDAISVREALYLKTPVIATDNGMRPDGVRLVPVGDVDKLAQAMLSIKADESSSPVDAPNTDNIQKVIALYEQVLLERG